MSTPLSTSAQPGKSFKVGLWAAQSLLAALFIPTGLWKLSQPVASLAQTLPWAGQVAEAFVRFIGVVDLAAGLGVLLPALTGIQPRLTVWAARGVVLLQVLAAAFHLYRGELEVLPLNAVLLGLAVFVAVGRDRVAPIAPRG